MGRQIMSANLRRKRWLGKIFSPFANREMDRSVILIYHSVGGGELSTKIEYFREQMAWLSANAEVVSLDSLIDKNSNLVRGSVQKKIRVVLTFDDGYRTVHDVVAPILAQYGFPATVYVNTGHIGNLEHQPSSPLLGHYPDEFFMTWEEVVNLHSQGWVIGSHGVEHLDLTKQDEKIIALQLSESKFAIRQAIGEECRHFSYTWGHYNPTVRSSVVAAGYCSAVAGLHNAVILTSDQIALPRLDIRANYELRDFIDVVTGAWDFLGLKQRLSQIFL